MRLWEVLENLLVRCFVREAARSRRGKCEVGVGDVLREDVDVAEVVLFVVDVREVAVGGGPRLRPVRHVRTGGMRLAT